MGRTGESVEFMRGLGVQPGAWAPFDEGRNNPFRNEWLVVVKGLLRAAE